MKISKEEVHRKLRNFKREFPTEKEFEQIDFYSVICDRKEYLRNGKEEVVVTASPNIINFMEDVKAKRVIVSNPEEELENFYKYVKKMEELNKILTKHLKNLEPIFPNLPKKLFIYLSKMDGVINQELTGIFNSGKTIRDIYTKLMKGIEKELDKK